MNQKESLGNRIHIGIFGRTNTGKSSLINALTGHSVAIVSDQAGTTTDPVSKSIEIHPLGPCVIIDTAGFDDDNSLGELRVERTKKVADKIDVAIVIFNDSDDFESEAGWVKRFRQGNIPIVAVINKSDILGQDVVSDLVKRIDQEFNLTAVVVSATAKTGIKRVTSAIAELLPEGLTTRKIVAHLVSEGDTVMLVMPQDIAAPKGRLILPQVQTTRELLDHKCVVISVTQDKLQAALDSLKSPPKLIITDSQVFSLVKELKPKESKLTSFSVLFAGYKGDVEEFIKGATALDSLKSGDRVLIAEACTHTPTGEDIGRVKIPNLLKKRYGELSIDIVNGADFPEDLTGYNLVIHCGACMFNRRHVLTRIERAKEQGVPISNYGIVLAKLSGILEDIVY